MVVNNLSKKALFAGVNVALGGVPTLRVKVYQGIPLKITPLELEGWAFMNDDLGKTPCEW